MCYHFIDDGKPICGIPDLVCIHRTTRECQINYFKHKPSVLLLTQCFLRSYQNVETTGWHTRFRDSAFAQFAGVFTVHTDLLRDHARNRNGIVAGPEDIHLGVVQLLGRGVWQLGRQEIPAGHYVRLDGTFG